MFDSIRTRLTLWYIGLLTAFIAVISLIIYSTLTTTLDRDLDLRLTEIAESVKTAVAAEKREMDQEAPGDRAPDAIREISDEMRLKDFPFIVFGPHGEEIRNTSDFEFAFNAGEKNDAFSDVTIEGRDWRVYRTDLGLGSQPFTLYVFHSLSEQQTLQRQLAVIFLILGSATLLLAGWIGYVLVQRALEPLAGMGKTAQRITAKNLDERLAVRNSNDELGRLAIVMNQLLERLAASFDQQKRFMADASHELRTPIAIVRGESEVSLSRPDRAIGEYRESLRVINDESQRLTKIVEDLFTLARADAGHFSTKFEPVYLDEIVADSVRSVSVLARAKDVRIDVFTNGEMPLDADETLLRRLFINLLDNAVKYNREGGSVSVRSETSGTQYNIQVSDTGTGIPAAEHELVFDRFYRSDKSRTRGLDTETGGAGLGLAISKWIAEIHRGKIELVSSGDAGSTFSVTLPR